MTYLLGEIMTCDSGHDHERESGPIFLWGTIRSSLDWLSSEVAGLISNY